MVTGSPSTSQKADDGAFQQLLACHQQEREQHQQERELSFSVVVVLRKWTLYQLARQAMQTAYRQGPLTKADATTLVDNDVGQMQQVMFANPSCPAPVEEYGPTSEDVDWATNALFNGGRLPSLW